MSQVVEGPTTNHLHTQHDGDSPDYDRCSICQEDFEEAYAEHAWMGRAVKGNPTNPYAPERDWWIDEEGWVKVDA